MKQRSHAHGLLALLIALAAVAVPMLVARNSADAFREPKELMFESMAILVIAAILIALLYRGRDFILPLREHHRIELMIVAAAVVWTIVTTLTSTHRMLSALTALWVVSCAAMFLATLLVARAQRGLWLVTIVFVPAILSAVVALLQRTDIWNPLVFTSEKLAPRIRTTGYIGDPNNLAAYLMVPALAALALAVAYRGRARFAAIAIAVLLTSAILATETLTVLAAFGVGVAVMLVMLSPRRAVPALATAAVIAVLVAYAYAPLRARLVKLKVNYEAGNYVEMLSLRTPAFAAAWEMFRDRPVFGFGPGTYGFWYLPYKLELTERDPRLRRVAWNFGQAHNDHLQTLAVSGLPGYAIFIAALVVLARKSRPWRMRPDEDRARFAKLLALPLAAAFAVLALALFPLEVAPVVAVLLHFAALACAWSTPA